ncbi:MAG: hypothetical protein WDN28_22440 [Chthoniobacter sp.]
MQPLPPHRFACLDDEGWHAEILREAVVIQQHTVAQHLGHEMPHVLERHVRPPFGERPHAGGADQGLHRPRAGAPADEALHVVAGFHGLGMGAEHEPHGVIADRVGHDDFLENAAEREDARAVHDLRHFGAAAEGGAADHFIEFRAIQEGHVELEHEAIELRLGSG